MVLLGSAFDPDLGILLAFQLLSEAPNRTHLIRVAPEDQSARYLALLGNMSWPSTAYDMSEQRLFLIDCQRSQLVTLDVSCLLEDEDEQLITADFVWSDVGATSSQGPPALSKTAGSS